MNALCYKIVFSKRLGTLVAVGEHTVGQGKTASGSAVRNVVSGAIRSFIGALSAVFAAVALTFLTASFTASVGFAAGPAANALPSGASVNSGSVAITSSAATMNITQTTDKASVDWQSFNIGSAAHVNVQQNSASSVLLNRVVGNDPSQIFGKLSANGQVILINPNGIVFGSGGAVTASAFTASTFGVSEQDFASGKYKYNRSASTAGITVEEGATLNATASGGYIALIGASVDNQGRISTQQGAVVMAAGENIALPAGLTDNISVPLSGKVRLELMPSAINAMVSNSGTITTEGGQVLMQAAALSDAVASVTHTGSINTTGDQGGAVTMLTDKGNIKVSGSITANSSLASNKGGDIIIGRDEVTGMLAKSTDVSSSAIESKGGFVETSAHLLAVDGIKINAGTWLLDPDNIEITDAASASLGYSKISASTIATALINTNVVINTTGAEVNVGNNSAAAGDGNILVSSVITKTGATATKLTLNADNGITVNQKISSTGGALDVEMNALGNSTLATNSKGIVLNNVIDANGGVVTLTGTNRNAAGGNANSGVVFNGGSSISAGQFVVKGYQLGASLASNTDKNGIYFNGSSSLKSTGASSLAGTSNSQGNLGAGIYAESGANLTLDSGTTGTISFVGGNSNASYRGVRLGGTSNATINVKGKVSFEGTDASTSPKNGVFLRANVTQQSDSTLTLKGASVEIYGGTTVAKAVGATNTTLNLGDLIPAYANGSVNIGSAGFASLAADNINIVGSASADGQQGVLIQAGSTLTANTIYVKGSALGAAGVSATAKGIHLSNGILNATNNITLDGTSTNVTGVALETGSVTSSGGAVVIKATTTAGQYQGANIVVAVSGKSVEIKGNSTNHIGVNIGAAVTSTGGGVTIEGTSVNSTGVYVNNSLTSTAGDINITGISDKADGVYVGNSPTLSKIISNDGAINITGTSDQLRGVWLDNNAKVQSIKSASTPLALVGITIKGKSTGSVPNNNVGAQIQGAVTAAGKLSITGDTLGVGLYQGVNISKAVSGDTVEITGTSVKHIGVSIQNTGSVTSIGATPTGSSSIVIDGTSYGSAVAVQGVSVAGTVKGASVFVKGMTAGNIGVDINAAVESTVGDIKLTGTGGSNYDYGQGVWTRSAGTLKSAKAITIDGTATNGTSGNRTVIGAQIQGTVTAGTDISITGKNTSTTDKAGLSIENTIKSTGGNITVTAENTSGTNTALSLSAAGKLLTDDNSKFININTNGMDLNATSVVQAGSLSTGTVNIKKTIGNNHISLGGVDVGSNIASSQTLGISQAELNRIQAGNLVIGDASKSGNINVSGAVSTLVSTGNLTLQTGGNIDVNQALTIASGKSLTLNGAGASSTISQANASAGITADQVEFLGSNATVSLQPTSSVNKIGVIAGNVKSFALTNQRDLTVSTVKSTDGLTAKDNIVLTTTTALGTALSIAKKIESTTGNVELNGTSSDATSSSYAAVKSWAAVKGKDVTMNAVALGTSGKTLGYYGAGDGGEFTASNILTLIGTSKNDGNGFYMFGGKLSAGNTLSISGTSTKGQGLGFEKASSLNVNVFSGSGTTITGTASTAGQEAIGLRDVTLTNSAGAVTFTATAGDIFSNTTNTLTQNGDGGVMFTTVGNGNITVPKIINHGTGNVVIAAGSDLLAGNGGGGQVKTDLGNTISQGNTTPGNTYIYSGSAANTGLLSRLDNSFSDLRLSGDIGSAQNADSNVKYAVSTTIAGGAKAQVMFREKIALNTSTIVGGILDKTYGDANTTSAAGDQAGLFTEIQAKLKQVNVGEIITRSLDGTNGAGEFKISKAALIEDLSGSLATTTASFSTSAHLKATTHDYTALTSNKYSATLGAGEAKVAIAQKALAGSIEEGNTTYGNALVAGIVHLNNKVGTDVVDSTGVTFTTTGKTSSSGNLKAGTHSDVQKVTGLAGDDKDNYTFADVKGSYKVDQRSVTALYAANDKVYDGNTNAIVVGSLQNTITGDDVTPTHTSATFDTFAVDTNKTVTVTGISLSGVDFANYKIDPVANPTYTASAKAAITPSAPTPPAPVVPTDATNGRVKIPVSAANPFQLASAEEPGGEDFCSDTGTGSLDSGSNASCTCEESKVAQDAQICFEKNTQKVSVQ